ncbi:MAG: nitroreductase family protein [Lachnospiraceae bacterium]|nr:nitroreductase family protein [Lachnospiraceae bacterium]
MKETIQDLKTRRSMRTYKPEQITKNELVQVLEAGMNAPSGMNRQAAVMVVIQEPEMVKKLSAMNAAVAGEDSDPFYGAPTVIVVLADRTIPTYQYDGSLVMGNLLNAAYALGLGACWIHRAKEMFSSEEGKKLLKKWGLDERYEGIGNCIIGYGEGGYPEAGARKENYVVWD